MKTEQGFTLIELLVTISVIGVALVVGVPSMIDVIHNNRLTTQANTLAALLNTAKSEAIKRGRTVTVCPGSPAGCSADWSNGLVLFMDADSGGDLDSGEEIIRVFGKISDGNTLNAVDGGGTAVTILGYSDIGNSTRTSTTTFTLCDPTTHYSRVMSLTIVGHLSTSKSTC